MGIPLVSVAKIELTAICNYQCTYCYNDVRPSVKGPLVKQQKSSDSKKKKLASIIEECLQNNIQDISFTGGEPLTTKDLLFFGIEKATELDIFTSLNTNLSLLTAKDIEMMAESGLKSLLVSCPSYDEETFTKITRNKIGYNRFLENLGLVRDADMNCTVNMVVTQANKHQVYETGKLLHESYGVANFGATPISPSTPQHIDKVLTREESIKVFDDLKQLHHDYGLQVTTLRPIPLCLFPDSKDYSEFMRCCSLMKNEIYITIEGDVSGCGSVPLVYGNLFDEGLRTCIEKGAEQHSSEKIIPSECTPCAEANICRGGCRAEAMTTFGEISSVNPYFVEILNEKKLPDIQPSINMYEATIIIDPEANLRQGDTKDVFVYSAFGNEVALNKYESNLMALFEKEGLSLSDLTQRHTLNSRAVNQFFNNMANKGGISLGGN